MKHAKDEKVEAVCVAAFDNAGFPKTSTSCDPEDAQHYAKYYRSVGYKKVRVLHYGDELDKAWEDGARSMREMREAMMV